MEGFFEKKRSKRKIERKVAWKGGLSTCTVSVIWETGAGGRRRYGGQELLCVLGHELLL